MAQPSDVSVLTLALSTAGETPPRSANGRTIKHILTTTGTQGVSLVLLRGPSDQGPFGVARDTDGSPILLPITAGDGWEFDRDLFDGMGSFKLRTVTVDGTTTQTQSAARTIYVWLLP